MVGQGVHRMAQRHKRTPAVSRSLPTPCSRQPLLLLSPAAGGARATGGTRPAGGPEWLCVLPLLVWRASPAGAAGRRHAEARETRLPLLPLLGERGMESKLGRRQQGCADASGILSG